MSKDTRRLVQLEMEEASKVDDLMDMLLAKKRAGDRKIWLESRGDQADLSA
jgi:topoisomerase-4 subunit B